MKRIVINLILIIGIIISIFGFSTEDVQGQTGNVPSCLAGEGLGIPTGVAVNNAGDVFVADALNHVIRRTNVDGSIDVYGIPGQSGYADGPGNTAMFNSPNKIFYFDDNTVKYLYVADTGNHAIRRIDLSLPKNDVNFVTTVAPSGFSTANPPQATSSGNFQTGTESLSSATFNSPKGIYAVASGVLGNPHIAVADSGNHAIRLIKTNSNEVVTIAGNGNSGSVVCNSLTCAPAGSPLEQCNTNQFNSPHDVVVRKLGLIYSYFVTDTDNSVIQGIRNDEGTSVCGVRLLAGSGSAGYNEGIDSSGLPSVIEFDHPTSIVPAIFTGGGGANVQDINSGNAFWISDSNNNVVRYLNIPSTSSMNFPSSIPFAGIQMQAGYEEGSAEWYAAGNPNPPQGTAKFSTPTGMFLKTGCTSPGGCAFPSGYDNTEFLVVDTGNRIIRKIIPSSNPATDSWKTTRFFVHPWDVMFKLESETNSHVEEWDGAGEYPIGICHTDIFPGVPLLGNVPDRTCGAGNIDAERILRIEDSTNSHAERPDLNNPNYVSTNPLFPNSVDVCYQDLDCTSVQGNQNCPSGKTEVVSLSGSTNAHVETAGSNIYSSSGNRKICCSAFIAPTTTFAPVEWRDYANIQIPTGELVCLGQTILAYSGTNLLVNSLVNVEVWDRDPAILLNPDDLLTPTPLQGTVVDNAGVLEIIVPWELTQAAFDLGGGDEGLDPELDIEFEISVVGSSGTSNLIKWSEHPEDCSYEPPTGGISGASHRSIWFTGNTVNLDSDCKSEIGPIESYSWEIVLPDGTSVTSTNKMISSPLTWPGQYEISLTCTDLKGVKVSDQIAILSLASPGIMAYVNEPEYWGVGYLPPVSGASAYFETEILFNGDDSFAVLTFPNVGIPQVDCKGFCLTGNCPVMTEGKLIGCGSAPEGIELPVENDINVINGYLAALGAQGSTSQPIVLTGDFNDLEFEWTFSDDNFNLDWANNGQGANSGYVRYDDVSDSFNDKHIELTVKEYNQISELLTYLGTNYPILQIPVQFEQMTTRDFTLGYCLNGGNDFITNEKSQLTVSTLEENNACKGGDGSLGTDGTGTGDECCPSNMECRDDDSDSFYKCEPIAGPIVSVCGDYENMDDCGNYQQSVAVNSYTGSVEPNDCDVVSCVWNSVENTCEVRFEQYSLGTNGICNVIPTGCTVPNCDYNVVDGDCVNGEKTITRTLSSNSNPNPMNSCISGGITCLPNDTFKVACGRLQFDLNYFGYVQFIAATLIIVLIYLAMGINRKRDA